MLAVATRLAGAFCLLVLTMGGQQARGQQAAEPHGVVVGNMDPAVKPGDDFFRYCNGGWLQRTEIPADRPSVSVFATLRGQERPAGAGTD